MVVDAEKLRIAAKASNKLWKWSLGAHLSINAHFQGVVYEQQNRDDQEFKLCRKPLALSTCEEY
jgi:hypothetical protein